MTKLKKIRAILTKIDYPEAFTLFLERRLAYIPKLLFN